MKNKRGFPEVYEQKKRRYISLFHVHFLLLPMIALLFQGCYSDKECLCVDYYAPVCGENGKTYRNPCEAECKDIPYVDGECPVWGAGIIEFTGDTIFGCDYLVAILNEKYSPDALAEKFRVEGLHVTLKYRRLNQYATCNDPYGHYRVIQILEIDSF